MSPLHQPSAGPPSRAGEDWFAEVIGDPIAQSRSPLIHRFWLDKLAIAGRYERVHLRSDELATYFSARHVDPEWRGCNVTVPHKQAVLPFLDRIDPLAARIGAVNTIVAEKDGLAGYNSDAPGFLEPLRTLLAESHLVRMARVLGTGGAALAIAEALASEGLVLVIIGRDLAKAQAIAARFGDGNVYAADLADFARPTDFAFDDRTGYLDLVVNATTLGMTGMQPLDFDFSHVPPGSIVYDIVYSPLETPLLAKARARGLRTIDGLAMLIGQAAVAFEKFFGAPAPREHDAEVRALLTA